jgi:hypothetical protein
MSITVPAEDALAIQFPLQAGKPIKDIQVCGLTDRTIEDDAAGIQIATLCLVENDQDDFPD